MNTNNALQMDVLDILFDNKNKTYGAYQLRRHYNKRLSIALAVMLSVCLLFTIVYGLGTKERISAPVLSTIDVNLTSAPPKDKKLIVVPPPVKPIRIEQPVATIKVTPPRIVRDEDVTAPPPTIDDMENVKIDVITKGGVKEDLVAPPVEQSTVKIESLVKGEDFTKEFYVVQKQAMFPGGNEAWTKYLQRNLRADAPQENGAPTGSFTVMVSFLVSKDGTISEVRAENDPGYGTAAEAVRVIQRGPAWNPAVQNGRNVIYRQKQAITFVVEQQP